MHYPDMDEFECGDCGHTLTAHVPTSDDDEWACSECSCEFYLTTFRSYQDELEWERDYIDSFERSLASQNWSPDGDYRASAQ